MDRRYWVRAAATWAVRAGAGDAGRGTGARGVGDRTDRQCQGGLYRGRTAGTHGKRPTTRSRALLNPHDGLSVLHCYWLALRPREGRRLQQLLAGVLHAAGRASSGASCGPPAARTAPTPGGRCVRISVSTPRGMRREGCARCRHQRRRLPCSSTPWPRALDGAPLRH